MGSRGRGGGHGRGFRCVRCGGEFPITRRNLKQSKQPEGFICVKCEKNPKRKKGRPTDYAR